MSEFRKIPPTPKLGSISLPDDNDSRIFGGSRARLSSFFAKANKSTISRSVTPMPVSKYEYPKPDEHSRQRASSMTGKSAVVPERTPKTTAPPLAPQPARGGSSRYRQYPTGSGFPMADKPNPASTHPTWTNRFHGGPAAVAPGKHEGPDTPKYMKAKVKEVSLKEECIVLSWPLVRYADRKHLNYPLVYYDAAFDPMDAANLRDNRKVHFLALPQQDRDLPVSTHCTLTEMVIDCPYVGQLVVRRPEGLRCIDVFNAIYCKYQKKPRSSEMPANMEKYLPAFEQRCRDCPGLAEFNRTKVGFLRVDLLRGKRIVEGLKRSGANWELTFDAPRGRPL